MVMARSNTVTKITLLRLIPTMTFIHFLTGKSSGKSSGILSDISSGILSGILSGKSSGKCSGISSGILSGTSSGILSGISSGILSDISSGILSGTSSGILSGISSGILSDISSGILSDISSGILSDIPSGISSGILSGRWGRAVPTGIWSSRLRSGSAHWDLELAVEVRQCPLRPGSRGWGPAVPTAICNSRLRSGSAHWDLELVVEVRLCPLGSGLRGGGGGWGGGGGGEELCENLATLTWQVGKKNTRLEDTDELVFECLERPLDASDVSSMPALHGDNAVARAVEPPWVYNELAKALMIGEEGLTGLSYKEFERLFTTASDEEFTALLDSQGEKLIMRITGKPENGKLIEAVREIGDLNEVAKEFVSAVNQGYLHGPCRSVAVSVGKSLIYSYVSLPEGNYLVNCKYAKKIVISRKNVLFLSQFLFCWTTAQKIRVWFF